MNPIKAQRYLICAILFASTNTQATIQTINFDTDASGNPLTAPTLFSAASSLTNQYADQGVNFAALNRVTQSRLLPKDGIEVTQTVNVMETSATGMGSILNERANFGNNARSGDNFLAFNNQSAANSNFWRISFDNPIGYFGINYSNGQSSTYQYLYFDAYDSDDHLIGSSYVTYLGDYGYYINNYITTAFKSDLGISYIDVGQGLECCGNTLTSNARNGNWSLDFDDLIYGDFVDAPYWVYNISGNNVYAPLPGAIWLMVSGVLGVLGLGRRNRLTI